MKTNDGVMQGVNKSIKNLVESIDQILEQVSQLKIQSPVLDKAINFIKSFLVKYLMNTNNGEESNYQNIKISEFDFHGADNNVSLVAKLEKLETEMKNLADQLLDSQNQNQNLIEKLKELEIQNVALKNEVECIKKSSFLETESSCTQSRDNLATSIKNVDSSIEEVASCANKESVISIEKSFESSSESVQNVCVVVSKDSAESKEISYEIQNSKSQVDGETYVNSSTTSLKSV